MVMLQPLAVALRTDRGRRNVMVHTCGNPLLYSLDVLDGAIHDCL
jgi:hypothetical protein